MKELLKKTIDYIRRFFRDVLHYRTDDLPYYLSILFALIIFVAAINGFVDLTEELAENNLEEFDRVVTKEVIAWRNDGLTQVLIFITEVGDTTGYVVVIALLIAFFLIRRHNWKYMLQITAVLLLATLSNMALKEFINRTRPTAEHLVTVSTLSYPSGHAMSAMAFYGFLIFLAMRYKINRILRICLISLLAILIFLIGISRIYLGVHFPSDVLAGFMGGLIWVAFCAIVFDIIDLMRKRKTRIGQQASHNGTDVRRQ